MKKQNIIISNPDELNEHLQHTTFEIWFIFGIVVAILIGFFVWSFIYKLKVKISGHAFIENSEVTLTIKDEDLSKLEIDQKVYINDIEGKILSFYDNGQPQVSNFNLDDGEYTYYIVVKEIRPIDFLVGK